MPGRLQITVDCKDPQRLTGFWAAALGYQIEDPPAGFDSWNAYYRSVGVPDEELPTDADAADSIVDPAGIGPRIWFQLVPEAKAVKNRLHFDLMIGGGRKVPFDERRRVVDAEVDRLTGRGASVLRWPVPDGAGHYGVLMGDPEGNEFCVA
jgi:catechol 2,3-dioxygenase-like lactoylglutathione lyase family enzyme